MMDSDSSWLPEYFKYLNASDTYINGCVNNEEELASLIEVHRRTFSCSFVAWSDDKKKKAVDPQSRRILWQHKHLGQCIKDETTMFPFSIDNSVILSCQFGKAHRRNMINQKTDHSYQRKKKFHLQNTRKVNCSARIFIHRVTRYDSYGLDRLASRKLKESTLTFVNDEEKDKSHIIHVSLPLPGAHDTHILSKDGGLCSRINNLVKEKLVSLVSSGITSRPIVKSLLKHYVLEELPHPNGIKPSLTDRAFFPRNSAISNHINRALAEGKYAEMDQENLEIKISEWQSKHPDAKFFFRKCSEISSEDSKCDDIPDTCSSETSFVDENSARNFLFVHQTSDQQMLLNTYGKMVLLDATYKTTKYALPLFMLAVSTNVKYVPVAEFIVQSETSSNIKEALEIIKEWNPNWSPEHFMVDYSEEEYQALQAVFPTSEKFLCAFHREQSWSRWVKNSKHGLSNEEQDVFLGMMRQMASAQDVAVAVEEVKNSHLFKGNAKVRQYLNRYWLSNVQRWCDAYVKQNSSYIIPVTTTNGIEALNKSVKHSYLKLKSNGTLTTMVEILIEDFVPDMIMEYRNLNFASCSQYKRYHPSIPEFMHNRPRDIVKLLMRNMHSADYTDSSDVHELSPTEFEVKSEGSEIKWYRVNLEEPTCECLSFKTKRLPCKHIFAVFKHTEKSWDDLNERYRNSPYLTLDSNFIERDILSSHIEISEVKDEELEQLIKLIHTTEKQERNHAKSPENILLKKQVSVREQLKVMSDMSYNITDTEALDSVLSKTKALVTIMERSISKANNLPLHDGQTVNIKTERQQQKVMPLPRRKKLSRKKKRQETRPMKPSEGNQAYKSVPLSVSNFSLEASTSDNPGAPAIEGHSADSCTSYSEIQNDLQQASMVVNELWGHPRNYDVPVAKVHGKLVSDSDIRSLRGTQWLTDKVLDCYLLMMITSECDKGRKALYVPQSTMTNIMEGSFSINYFRTSRLSELEVVVGIFYRHAHWTLIVVEPQNGAIFFYNPSGEQDEEKSDILQKWCEFANMYSQQTGDFFDQITWHVTTKPHSRQQDGYNCGVYCLLFAEKHLMSEDMTNITLGELVLARKQIASKIMLFEAFLTDCCPKCGCSIGDDEEKVQCERCLRYYHFKNYCVYEDINDLVDTENFVCRLCKLNFWPAPFGTNKDMPYKKMQEGSKIEWTSKYEIISLLQQMENIDSDCQLLDCHIERENQYSHRRQVPKRKRSSFIYPPMKREKRSYCICKKPNDGRLYWMCAICREWFHPDCVGLKTEDEPEIFICEGCKAELDINGKEEAEREIKKPKKKHRVVRCSSYKQSKKAELPEQHNRDSDRETLMRLIGSQAEDEETFFVTAREAHQHIEPALEKVKDIVHSSMENEDIQMQRHRTFLHTLSTETVKRGYGFAVFSCPALLYIEQQVKKRFYVDKTSKAYTKHGQIVGMRDESLLNAFKGNKYLANLYCSEVLCKETIVNLFQTLSGATYEEADRECSSTEDRSLVKATEKGFNMSNQKKMYWTQQKKQKDF